MNTAMVMKSMRDNFSDIDIDTTVAGVVASSPRLKAIAVDIKLLVSIGFTDKEFVAVMLHELGHIRLEHPEGAPGITSKQLHEMEYEADRYAVEKGADVFSLISAIMKLHTHFDMVYSHESHSHPSILDRAYALGLNNKQYIDLIHEVGDHE